MTKSTRISLRDIDKSIFRPNEVELPEEPLEDYPEVVVYTMNGKQDYFDDQGFPVLEDTYYDNAKGTKVIPAEDLEEAYAKQTCRDGTRKFFAKMNPSGNLYNPHDLYAEFNQHKKRANGDPVWQWRHVTQRVFELYTSFLKTNNKSLLSNAQRINIS